MGILADGNIKIAISVDGKEVDSASDSLRGLGESAQGVKPKSESASKGIRDIAVSLGLVQLASKAFSILANSMDSAISRFDTFQTFPSVMDALGVSAEDSSAGIDRLSSGIDGLPTKLDDIVTVTQRMFASFKNLDDSTDTALALNNALLASGASASDAQRGTDQYIQVLQKGKFEIEEWKTLQETMTIGLFKIAESFGMTERELKSALDSGEISIDDFNNKLIELGSGTGELAGLAKKNSQTIATALTNLRNTASRGLADIIEAFSDLSKEISGKSLYDNLEGLKGMINRAFKVVSNTIRASADVVVVLYNAFDALLPVIRFLEPAIWGLVSAYTAMLVIQKVQDVIAKTTAIYEGMAGTILKITTLTQAKTTAELLNSGVQATYLKANLASMKALTAKNIVLGLLTGNLTLSTAASLLSAKAIVVLKGAITALTGPVGLAVAGIGLLVAGGVALVKWFNKSTSEGQKLAKQTEKLGEATGQLNSEVESNQKSYDKQIRTIDASTEANQSLAKQVEELSKVENKSKAEKELLADYVEQLNDQMDGLNLAYSEEADAMNMSSEEIAKRIELQQQEESGLASRERMLEIEKERAEVEAQLAETNELRAEYNEKLEEGTIKNKEFKTAIEELNEQEQTLKETSAELAEEHEATNEVMLNAYEEASRIAEESIGKQIILYDQLSDGQKQAVDEMRNTWASYQESATNMFDTLSEKSEVSVAEMTANMEENQRVIANWSENIAILAERGLDEGLLEKMRKAGPESAGHVKAMVNASDTELEELSTAFAEGGDVATDALTTSLGEGSEEALKELEHLVVGWEQTMKSKINSPNFPSLGGDMATGTADGVEKNAKEAVDAVKTMSDDMTSGAREVLKTQSPSKVFTDIGRDTTDGMALGITKGTKTVLSSLTKIALAMPLDFSSMYMKFTHIGQQISGGLADGINSGSGRVLATARSLANSVTSTMQSALRINSPSGELRDEVGRWVPEGLADGIEDTSRVVYDAIDKMYAGMMKVTTPELALGVGGYGLTSTGNTSDFNRLTGGTSTISHNTPQKTERNLSISIHAETKEPLDESELLRRARLEAMKAGYEFQL